MITSGCGAGQGPERLGSLLGLIHALDAHCRNFIAPADPTALSRLALAALREAGTGGGSSSGGKGGPCPGPTTAQLAALQRTLVGFGWDGWSFPCPLDTCRLASQLRSLLYVGGKATGSGTYSLVYSGRSRVTGSAVALKRMKLDGTEEGIPTTALREISLLRELAGSPHIVQLLDVLWDRRSLYLVMEMLDCDLQEYLDTTPAARQLPVIKSIMYQILKGMAHAHAHRVVHRDLKPQNILVDKKGGCIKVADFGLARTILPPLRPYTHEVVSLLYRAPELLLGSPLYSTPVDSWSLGCMLAELATGLPLFRGDSEIGQLMCVFQLLGTPGEEQWPGVSDLPDWQQCFPKWLPCELAEAVPQLDALGLDLLSSFLCYEPTQRITCRKALAHPWFDEVRAAEEARGRAVQERGRRERQEQAARVATATAAAIAAAAATAPAAGAGVAADEEASLDLDPQGPSTPYEATGLCLAPVPPAALTVAIGAAAI